MTVDRSTKRHWGCIYRGWRIELHLGLNIAGQKYFYYLIGENDEAIEAGKYVSRYTLADAKQYVDDTLRRQEERRTEYNQLR